VVIWLLLSFQASVVGRGRYIGTERAVERGFTAPANGGWRVRAYFRLMIVYAVVDDALSPDFPLGNSLEVFVRREDAERFVGRGMSRSAISRQAVGVAIA
jgi:hypothetical protein